MLLSQKEQAGALNIRRVLASGDIVESTERLIDMISKTKTNDEFMERVCKDLNVQDALRAKGFKTI